MKRYILIQGSNCLSKENYIEFIKQCYNAWQCTPVKNVDLIIEYQREALDNSLTLKNTEKEWVYGIPYENMSIDEICNFVESELHCDNYLIARIRNRKVINFCMIK